MTLVGFATVIGCTAAGNLILNLGAGVSDAERVLFGFSAGSRGGGSLCSGMAVSSMPSCCVGCRSDIAQVFAAAQLVGVVALLAWC